MPKHEVYGFVPYWEMDETIAEHVEKVDLTTLALFSVTHRRSGELATNQTGYKRITGPIGDADDPGGSRPRHARRDRLHELR